MGTPLFTVEIGLASATDFFTLDLTQLSPATSPAVDAPLGDDQGYAWTDVTDYALEGLTFRRGSTRSQGPFWRYEAGTASIELDNVDGRFDPLNLSGPYVSAGLSEIRPNLPVRISAVVDGTTETMWVGVVDSVDLDYASVTWSTVKLSCVDGVAWLQAAELPELTTAVGAGDTVAARIARITGVEPGIQQRESDQPWQAIIDAAREAGCDLIAMTSHGRNGVAALILGSQTTKVLTHSRIPVIVYR